MNRAMIAPWVALSSMTLSQLVMLPQDGMPWRGEIFWSLIAVEAGMLPALLITAVAVCVDARLTLDPQRVNLAASGDLRTRFLRRYGVRTAACFAAPALVAAAAVSLTWPEHWGYLPMAAAVHLLVALLSMVTILTVVLYVAVAGGVVGPVVGVIAVLWLGVTALNGGGLVALGSSTGSMLGFGPDWATLLVQTLAALGVIAASCWALVSWTPAMRGVTWRGIGAFAALVLLAISPALALAPYAPTDDGRLMCYGDGNGPRTCVAEQHARFLDPLHTRFEELRAGAHAAGVEESLPHTVVESFTRTQASEPRPGEPSDRQISAEVAGWRPTSEDLGASDPQLSRESVVAEIALPGHCPQLWAEEPPADSFWEDVDALTAAYLTLAEDGPSAAEIESAATEVEAIAPRLQRCDF